MVEQEIWRIRTKQELQELYKDLHIVADIKKKRLERRRHMVRMDYGMVGKEIFLNKLEASKQWEDLD